MTCNCTMCPKNKQDKIEIKKGATFRHILYHYQVIMFLIIITDHTFKTLSSNFQPKFNKIIEIPYVTCGYTFCYPDS